MSPVRRACGVQASPARYRAHLRAGEPTCADCRRKHADAVNAFRRRAAERAAGQAATRPPDERKAVA